MSKVEKNPQKQPTDETDYLGMSCSATDCTGLIPRGVTNHEELEAYEELYPYRPPVTDTKGTKI